MGAALSRDEHAAAAYFEPASSQLDRSTLAIYSEIGASPLVVEKFTSAVRDENARLESKGVDGKTVVTNKISPKFLLRFDSMKKAMQEIDNATSDAHQEKSKAKEKQELIDAVGKVSDEARKRQAGTKNSLLKNKDIRDDIYCMVSLLGSGASILGSGSENLSGDQKRLLIAELLRFSARLIEYWWAYVASLEIDGIADGSIAKLRSSLETAKDEDKARLQSLIDALVGLIDALEAVFYLIPVLVVMITLFEEAGDQVLLAGLRSTPLPTNSTEMIILRAWSADIDPASCERSFLSAVKNRGRGRLLRYTLARLLVSRAFWKHWKKKDVITVLEAADDLLQPLKVEFDRTELLAQIEGDKAGV